ncbi:MAG: hypothetical protein AAGA76_16325, partial [Pseudomonadota bacterium]
LEVRRLEIELKLVELGLNRGIAPVSSSSSGDEIASVGELPADSTASAAGEQKENIEVASAKEESWVDDGWTTEGLQE